jgi:hypothetical protein
MADEIVFMDPPRPMVGKGATGKTAARVAPLRERPGEWARIRSDVKPGTAASYAAVIRKGRSHGIEEGEFEVITRSNGDGTSDIFARVIGLAALPETEDNP